ncbi:hypothetical protein PS3A_05790 [Pseudomonas sp. 3A(2025)]
MPTCRYHYDALDRLATRTLLGEAMARRFYQADEPVTEIQGNERRSLLRADTRLLAQKKSSSTVLLGTDQQNSVVHAGTAAVAYAPYGHREGVDVPGFNGELPDPVTGHYLLGNGYRAYNPVLMRFNSPDSLSPFGEGGLNPYVYCKADPVNRSDPSGHANEWEWGLGIPAFLLGIGGGLWAIRVAKPSLRQLFARRSLPEEKLSAVSMILPLAAAPAGVVGLVVSTQLPDSEVPEGLIALSLVLGALSLGAQVRSHGMAKSRQKMLALIADSSVTPRASITGMSAASIRRNEAPAPNEWLI